MFMEATQFPEEWDKRVIKKNRCKLNTTNNELKTDDYNMHGVKMFLFLRCYLQEASYAEGGQSVNHSVSTHQFSGRAQDRLTQLNPRASQGTDKATTAN